MRDTIISGVQARPLISHANAQEANPVPSLSVIQVPSVATPLVNNQHALVQRPAETPALQQAVGEFNKAIMRVAHYEGHIENTVRDNIDQVLPDIGGKHKAILTSQAVDKIAEANQAFEFNHLGNDLLEHPIVEHMSKSFVRRTLEALSASQAEGVTGNIVNKHEGGIGFLDGWKTDPKEWAEQMNKVLSEEKPNSRVLTSLAYSYSNYFRNDKFLSSESGLNGMLNQELIDNKNANPRLDIFTPREAGSDPLMSVPKTTQPAGWPWLKYVDWNVSEALGSQSNFITQQPPKERKEFKAEDMQAAMVPAPYRRDSISLKESDGFQSGYSGYDILDKSVSTIGSDQAAISVNWRQQNIDKKLPMLAGPSSTTSLMYEVVRMLNMPAEEAQPFRLLLLGWMIQPRDHSFTEIMGALDAYAMEHNEGGSAIVASDEKMAWTARETSDWTKAYENLITEDVHLKGMEAKTIILNGQEIKLPALKPIDITKEEFDAQITKNSSYPSYYASGEYLQKLSQAIESDQELADPVGLASEKIKYAPMNMDTMSLYNHKKRVLAPIPERAGQDREHFLNDTEYI